jgi:CPA2 family monovalent cation:H+ antiporter-2
LFIAMGTLLISPQLMKLGLRWTDNRVERQTDPNRAAIADTPIQHALIIGMGPIGRQLASRLEIMGIDACLVDLSPINLQSFAQLGFSTVSGDARDPEVLMRARVNECRLAVVSVPDDEIANRIVRAVRELNPAAAILVRCRFQGSIQSAKRAGANVVVSEEAEASGKLLAQCEEVVRAAAGGASKDT